MYLRVPTSQPPYIHAPPRSSPPRTIHPCPLHTVVVFLDCSSARYLQLLPSRRIYIHSSFSCVTSYLTKYCPPTKLQASLALPPPNSQSHSPYPSLPHCTPTVPFPYERDTQVLRGTCTLIISPPSSTTPPGHLPIPIPLLYAFVPGRNPLQNLSLSLSSLTSSSSASSPHHRKSEANETSLTHPVSRNQSADLVRAESVRE